jgi:molybdate transport system substrate-binding protein
MSVPSANDRDITGISSMAVRQLLTELVDVYQQRSGQRVSVLSVGGVDAARRVKEGEPFDFVVLAADAIEQLAQAGRVERATRTDLVRSGIAMAIASGTSAPDVSTEAAVRDAVVQASSIGYSTGPSGTHLVRLFERWGIADTVTPRMVQASPGLAVATLVTRGDAELGFQQLSELMNVPGVEVIGMLPPTIQMSTVFSAAVCTVSNRQPDVMELLAFLASPQADAAKRRHGMEPM